MFPDGERFYVDRVVQHVRMPPCTLTHTLRVESSTADQRIAGRASVLDVGESTGQTKLAISAASLILNDCRYA